MNNTNIVMTIYDKNHPFEFADTIVLSLNSIDGVSSILSGFRVDGGTLITFSEIDAYFIADPDEAMEDLKNVYHDIYNTYSHDGIVISAVSNNPAVDYIRSYDHYYNVYWDNPPLPSMAEENVAINLLSAENLAFEMHVGQPTLDVIISESIGYPNENDEYIEVLRRPLYRCGYNRQDL